MSKVSRLYCDGGRWINIGTPIYLVPCEAARLELLREYKSVLSADLDIYRNNVCINENEAIKDIKKQMNIFQWIISKYL
jgi:hypothetical protein